MGATGGDAVGLAATVIVIAGAGARIGVGETIVTAPAVGVAPPLRRSTIRTLHAKGKADGQHDDAKHRRPAMPGQFSRSSRLLRVPASAAGRQRGGAAGRQ